MTLAKKGERIRRCILTGKELPASDLIRLVADPEGRLVPDVSARLPGRGVWISSSGEALASSIEDGTFVRGASHGLKRRIAANGALSELGESIEKSLERQCLSLLGLARGAGATILGFEKVSRALKAEGVGVLVIASDASRDSRGKVEGVAKGLSKPVLFVDLFDRNSLGDAIGVENAVFVALIKGGPKGGFASRFMDEALRLAAFRGKALRAIPPQRLAGQATQQSVGQGSVAPAQEAPDELEN